MRAASAMFLVLLMSAGVPAQSKGVETFQFEKKAGPHTARVVFRTRRFARAGHRSAKVVRGQTVVGGRPAIGTDGNIPGVEIESMRFYLDGKEVRIPRRLYADCFDPHLGNDYVTLEFGRGFGGVVVTMSGSDGAGAYQAVWRLRKDGRHSRSIIPGDEFIGRDTREEMRIRLACRFAILLVVSGAGALPAAAQSAPPRAIPHADAAQSVVIPDECGWPDEYGWMDTAGTSLDQRISAEDALTRPS